jgi:hypothetical protein
LISGEASEENFRFAIFDFRLEEDERNSLNPSIENQKSKITNFLWLSARTTKQGRESVSAGNA